MKQFWPDNGNKKFLVLGGYGRSKHDKKTHFVSAEKLTLLYGLRRECGDINFWYTSSEAVVLYNRPSYLMREVKDHNAFFEKLATTKESVFEFEGWTVLRPRKDGQYSMFRWFGL